VTEVPREPQSDRDSRRGGQVSDEAVREAVHELNNLLSVIRGHAQLAAGLSRDERTRDALEEIERAAGQAAVVTAGLYELAHADHAGSSDEPRRTTLW
jgi:signal transduction histidine kinase